MEADSLVDGSVRSSYDGRGEKRKLGRRGCDEQVISLVITNL